MAIKANVERLPLWLLITVYASTFAANCLLLWQYWWHVAGRGSDIFYYLPGELLGNALMFLPYLLPVAQLIRNRAWRTVVILATLIPWLMLMWMGAGVISRYFL